MKTFASIIHPALRRVVSFRRFVYCCAALLLAASILAPAHAATPVDGYKVVAKYPHSTESYTEGFFYLNGIFYEGTGLTGHSQLLAIDPQTGRATQHHDVPAQYFGEGIVDWGPNILEWTWQTHVGFVIDRFSMQVVRQFTYTGEGRA